MLASVENRDDVFWRFNADDLCQKVHLHYKVRKPLLYILETKEKLKYSVLNKGNLCYNKYHFHEIPN